MSINLPTRRAVRAAPTILKSLQPTVTIYPHSQRRTIKLPGFLEGLLGTGKKQAQKDAAEREEIKNRAAHNMTTRLTSTRLESDSIFDDEVPQAKGRGGGKELVQAKDSQIATPRQDGAGTRTAARSQERNVTPDGKTTIGLSLLKSHMQAASDPDPRGRELWLRKRVIGDIQRNLDPKGRETKTEKILRTEKTYTSHSPLVMTSTKKLVHLARQVAGKDVDDAIVQMQFSKKKFAKEVRYELQRARDSATISRGMGLGGVGAGALANEGPEPKRIKLKNGKSMVVTDPTKMYVAEAWVDKGRIRGATRIYNARGRSSRMLHKTSVIVLRLKEQKTLIREADDRKAKAYARGPWIHLPNRPVTAQRPYYSW